MYVTGSSQNDSKTSSGNVLRGSLGKGRQSLSVCQERAFFRPADLFTRSMNHTVNALLECLTVIVNASILVVSSMATGIMIRCTEYVVLHVLRRTYSLW